MSTLNTNALKTSSATTEVKDKTHSLMEEGKQIARDVGFGRNDLKEAFNEKKDLAIAWAKENPLSAAAIGVGVGFILGGVVRRIMSRRD